MTVGTDPSSEPVVRLWCVLMCIHHLLTVDPSMVSIQGAIPKSHTSMVKLQTWRSHIAGTCAHGGRTGQCLRPDPMSTGIDAQTNVTASSGTVMIQSMAFRAAVGQSARLHHPRYGSNPRTG